jgi:hypothetical protein
VSVFVDMGRKKQGCAELGLYCQVWKRLCCTLATKFVSSELADCMLHIALILTTCVRNLNWHMWGAFIYVKNSWSNLQSVSWSSRHYHALFSKAKCVTRVRSVPQDTNTAHIDTPCLLVITLMLFLNVRQGLQHSFPLPSFELRVGLSCPIYSLKTEWSLYVHSVAQ